MVDLNPRMLQAKGLAAGRRAQHAQLAEPGAALRHRQDRPVRVRREPEREPAHGARSWPTCRSRWSATPPSTCGTSPTCGTASAPQTNIVRRDGRRGTLLTVLKAGDASTLDVVDNIRAAIPAGGHHAAARAEGRPARRPVHLRPRRDRRGHPRGDHRGVPHRPDDPALPGELAQHADHRGLDPAVDPDLGDRAELPGRDHQHHDPGRPRPRGGHPGRRRHRDHREHRALPRGGARRCARPSWRARRRSRSPRWSPRSASASCSCRCSSWAASRATCSCRSPRRWSSRCSPPTCSRARWCPRWPCTCCARARIIRRPPGTRSRSLQRGFERVFERLRAGYRELLTRLLSRQGAFVTVFFAVCLCAWLLLPWLGENFFPTSDNGQFILHLRAKTGTRIEETARLADLVEAVDPERDPAGRARQHHRQHRPAVLDHQLHVQPLRLHRDLGRRHPGDR